MKRGRLASGPFAFCVDSDADADAERSSLSRALDAARRALAGANDEVQRLSAHVNDLEERLAREGELAAGAAISDQRRASTDSERYCTPADQQTAMIACPGVRPVSPWESYPRPSQLSPSPPIAASRRRRGDPSMPPPPMPSTRPRRLPIPSPRDDKENAPTSEDTSPTKVATRRDVFKVSGCVVSLTGMDSKARAVCKTRATQCRMSLVDCPKQWEPSITHLITPHLGRSEKVLAGMAAGAWILTTEWLAGCWSSGRVLDEAAFIARSKAPDAMAVDAAGFWRARRQTQEVRAFETSRGPLRAIFHPGCSMRTPSAATIARIFSAGGGVALPWRDPEEAGFLRIDFGVVHADPNQRPHDGVLAQLEAAGVPLVSELFLIEWLALPAKALDENVLRKGTQLRGIEAAMQRSAVGEGAGGDECVNA